MSGETIQRRLKRNRPSLRARARPPKQRSPLGAQFTAANLPVALALQHCAACGHVQYPPTELCGACLDDTLVYRETDGRGTLLTHGELHHSLWEYFKRRLRTAPWRMGSVKLEAGPVALVHVAQPALRPGAAVRVFSHTDASQSAVLIAVSRATPTASAAERRAIAAKLGLDAPARLEGGL